MELVLFVGLQEVQAAGRFFVGGFQVHEHGRNRDVGAVKMNADVLSSAQTREKCRDSLHLDARARRMEVDDIRLQVVACRVADRNSSQGVRKVG